MKVKFTEYREVEDGEGVVYLKFKAGQVYELSNASARYWIVRGSAFDVQAAARAEREAKEAEAEEAKASEEPVVETKAEPDKVEVKEPEAVEEKPEVTTAAVNPTSPKRGRGRPRSA